MVSPSESARLVLQEARGRPATLGAGRLLCIDGPGGAGKSTLGRACVEDAGGDARLVHMDDLFAGWSGLATVGDQLGTLLRPLAEGRPGTYRRYDWHKQGFAEMVTVSPTSLLVLEGVGSGSSAHADLCTLLVWVAAPSDLRLTRGIERDGEHLREHWLKWRDDEAEHFTRDATEQRADVLVDGTGREPPRLRCGRHPLG
jgi:uridine kinase